MEFDRNAFLTELENLPPEPTVAEKSANKPDPEPKEEEVKDAEAEVSSSPDAEESEGEGREAEASKEAGEEAEQDTSSEEEEEEQLDPKTAKALEIRQREEKRAKEAHTKRLTELRQRETEVKGYEAEVRQLHREVQAEKQKVESFMSRLTSDPVGVMREAGLAEDMYEYVSKQFYLLSKKGLENPKARELADRERRNRDAEARLEMAMRKIEALESAEQERLVSLQREAAVGKYLDDVQKAVTDDHKLVKKWLEKAPSKVRQRLFDIANDMATTLGYAPEPDEVLNALETARRAELEELGITVPSEEATKQPVAKKKPVTLSGDMGATRQSPKASAKSREEEIDNVRLALERGQFD